LYDAEAMFLADTQLTANEVLRAFQRDQPYLFLGAAFTTVGILSIAFCVIRKRFDPLLVWLAIFAFLYGRRLWLDVGLLRLTIGSIDFYIRLAAIIGFMVPIPGLWFFQAAGFLGRLGKPITIALTCLFGALVLGTAIIGNREFFHTVNNLAVVFLILTMMVVLMRRRADRDFAVVRIGLFTFGILSLYDNLTRGYRVEPYGFAVLLGSLGYVAARRTLKRDEELGEIHKELELAKRIQLSLLPPPFPDSVAFRVAARYVPMNTVAGDFYDFLVADATCAGILIADVSGHGVPAALIASMVKMAAISQRANAAHPGQLLTAMNRALCGNTQGQYVTAACVHIDAERRELRYAAAGHPAMLLLRHANVMEIAENGLLLAAVEDLEYGERTIPIQPGDRFLLYTDGLVEARNTFGELFGEESLINALKATAPLPPADAVTTIVEQVQRWSHSQDDDLTVLLCEFEGAVKHT
jgi:sigma-B regulation protein RsbU (phosphoserine phosphatase)